jgi:DNA-binding transcriptional ArsR family regulator
MKSKDALIHPVRLRILLTLANRHMTALELNKALPDIAQATLYRHLRALHAAGILQVVEERQVYSVMEKVYAVDTTRTVARAEDLSQMSKEDQQQMFMLFISTVMAQFNHYLSADQADTTHDQTLYRQIPLYLSDAEFTELFTEIGASVIKRLVNAPEPQRTRRLLTIIAHPEGEPKS